MRLTFAGGVENTLNCKIVAYIVHSKRKAAFVTDIKEKKRIVFDNNIVEFTRSKEEGGAKQEVNEVEDREYVEVWERNIARAKRILGDKGDVERKKMISGVVDVIVKII